MKNINELTGTVQKIRDITQKLIDDKLNEAMRHDAEAKELFADVNKLREAFNLLPKNEPNKLPS